MADKRIKVSTLTIQGQTFDVCVPEGQVRFVVTVGDVDVYGNDSESLHTKVAQMLAKQKVVFDIPVVLGPMSPIFDHHPTAAKRAPYQRATIRGRNIRTGAFLLTLADGSKEQFDHPNVIARGPDLTDADIVELNRLSAAVTEAARAESAYLREHAQPLPVGVEGLVREAEAAAGITR